MSSVQQTVSQQLHSPVHALSNTAFRPRRSYQRPLQADLFGLSAVRRPGICETAGGAGSIHCATGSGLFMVAPEDWRVREGFVRILFEVKAFSWHGECGCILLCQSLGEPYPQCGERENLPSPSRRFPTRSETSFLYAACIEEGTATLTSGSPLSHRREA